MRSATTVFGGTRAPTATWTKKFKDFLLSRILETRGERPSSVTGNADDDWNEYVTLEIGPHPDLSETQKKVIALDYGMRGVTRKDLGAQSVALLCPKATWSRHRSDIKSAPMISRSF